MIGDEEVFNHSVIPSEEDRCEAAIITVEGPVVWSVLKEWSKQKAGFSTRRLIGKPTNRLGWNDTLKKI